ncbi:MAG: hypothetical protein CL761_06225 [Chloroflexi bacterium]|nr:hypothetical protein [Chloroflexota bacterium]MCH2673545.1 polyprenyl synthetase family protein [Dehalococcoidia bacterium]|tara:strand:+ start:40716 stop:41738 length:1023 start_codon:yes stop_codon:yes gene_type:complete
MNKLSLPKIFDQYQNEIFTYTKSFYKDLQDDLYFSHKYFLGWIDENGKKSQSFGKAFRPSLMMLVNESLGGEKNNVLPLAMSIELFHNFSLIHDDIEDRDEIRRNRKTVWKIWGESKGIISGNSMHALASKSINLLPNKLDHKKIFLRKLISRTCLSVIEGQFLDISYENEFEINVENYLDMIQKKTGALIETSAILGSSLEKTSKKNISNFSLLGKLFGQIFQIKDDYLGIWGDKELGKPVGSDILKKKKSLPILHLIQSAEKDDKRIIENIFLSENINEHSKDLILKLMEKYKVEFYCKDILKSKFNECNRTIRNLEIDQNYKNILDQINTFLMYRKA